MKTIEKIKNAGKELSKEQLRIVKGGDGTTKYYGTCNNGTTFTVFLTNDTPGNGAQVLAEIEELDSRFCNGLGLAGQLIEATS